MSYYDAHQSRDKRMRVLRILVALGMFVATVACLAEITAPASTDKDCRSSWIGNSFGGRDGKWVQINIAAMCVTADGTCYTDSFWDEGGHEAGIYRNGDLIGALSDTHEHGGYAVTANADFVYIAYRSGEHDCGVRCYDAKTFQPANIGHADKSGYLRLSDSPTSIRGLALVGGDLFATDYDKNVVHVVSTADMTERRSWQIPHPERIAAAPDGSLWIAQRTSDGKMGIARWSIDGIRADQQVADIAEPSALCFDTQGRLLVAENGPDQQVRVFDGVTTQPRLVQSIGTRNGVFAGRSGQVGPMRFNGITGLGADAAGNLYISQNGLGPAYIDNNGFGAELHCYAPDGRQLWQLRGLEFVDTAEPDPASENDVYTRDEHFKMDYSKPAGQEAEWVGHTVDRFRFPDDPRLHLAAECVVGVRNIGGKKLLYLTNMYSEYLLIFRIDPGSETAIPCGMFATIPTKSGWPDSQPRQGDWIWRDANGDGRMGTDEFERHTGDNSFVWGWWVDQSGTVWKALREDGIRQFPMQGFDAAGNPIYNYADSKLTANPRPFTRTPAFRGDLNRIEYDSAADTMYLAGYTPMHPNIPSQWGQVGPVICRYDHWSQGNRIPRWEINPPYDAAADPQVMDRAMSVAGGYLFITYYRQAQVLVYDLDSGKPVTKLTPGPEVGGDQVGWVDVPYGVRAFKRTNGEYLVFNEEDYRAKILMYRWQPPAR